MKGRQKAVSILEAFDGDPPAKVELKRGTRELFERALGFYFEREFARAAERFSQVIARNPEDVAAKHYLRRSAELMLGNVPADWDGVETMTEK